jgi:hypothetical protein
MERPTVFEIARLAERDWQRERFAPRDGVRLDERARKVIVPSGWGHEHCLICNSLICDRGDGRALTTTNSRILELTRVTFPRLIARFSHGTVGWCHAISYG